jgi:hypothetical protein
MQCVRELGDVIDREEARAPSDLPGFHMGRQLGDNLCHFPDILDRPFEIAVSVFFFGLHFDDSR